MSAFDRADALAQLAAEELDPPRAQRTTDAQGA
jgi:hypothetical protein